MIQIQNFKQDELPLSQFPVLLEFSSNKTQTQGFQSAGVRIPGAGLPPLQGVKTAFEFFKFVFIKMPAQGFHKTPFSVFQAGHVLGQPER